ncbi:MAG: dCTP deaminase [Nanoarchaeota archaeon]|nr:dCTP deaminase [Nanoarchaeota archaeon]
MVLTKAVIKREIKDRNIKVKPYKSKYLGDASLDICLGDEFWVFGENKNITLNDKTDFKKYTKKIKANSITLMPGAFVLGMSKEKISLPSNICGFLSGRSRFARMGIVVHATAFVVHPGVSNRQMFEIKNMSNNTLTLKKGLRIAQLVFMRTEGQSKYKGRYKKQ